MDTSIKIQTLLTDIENQHNVKIIHAVESGSRAWGFPSKDSDFDIRFIYHHSSDWYLSAFQKRDFIDTVFIDDLDAGGWDLSKCLQLLHKGNAPLYEWLNSPVVYRKDEAKLALLQDLSVRVFNPKVIFHHYLSLARKKILDEKTGCNAKTFLYALRAILCARWVADDGTVPPVDFSVLQHRYLDVGIAASQLKGLLADKLALDEADIYQIPFELMSFSKSEFTELEARDVVVSKVSGTEIYDEVLRGVLGSKSSKSKY